MKTILIVYHSLTGGTRQMADAAAGGAQAQANVQVHLLQAREAGPDDVLPQTAISLQLRKTSPQWPA